MCSAEKSVRNNTEYRVYLDTISRYKYVMANCYISEKLKMVLNPEKSYNLALFREHFHQYFKMLLHAKLLNLKTFHLWKIKDF